MLTTPFGNIRITLDEVPVSYIAKPVENPRLFPDVNGAFLLKYDFIRDSKSHQLCCFLDNPFAIGGSESGERLEAISIYMEEGKLTIGCEADFCDPPDFHYDYTGTYLSSGIKLLIPPQMQSEPFLFGVSWLNHCTPEHDLQTWFAADPTITAIQDS